MEAAERRRSLSPTHAALLHDTSSAADNDDEVVDASLRDVGSFDQLSVVLAADFASEEARLDRTYFQHQVLQTRRGLRRRWLRRLFFLDPHGTTMQYWDICTCLALLYTASVTPYEVCVGLPTRLNALFVVNSVVNAVFFLDIVVQFFVPVQGSLTDDLVRSHSIIARRYLTSWFLLDVLTVLPFDALSLLLPDTFDPARDSPAGAPGNCVGGGSAVLLKGVKLLRIFRLFKLLRVLRASRIIQRWESRSSIPLARRQFLLAWVIVLVAMHWLACLWALLPTLMSNLREEDGLAEALHRRMNRELASQAMAGGSRALTGGGGGGGLRCEACLCGDDMRANPACASPCLTECEIDEVANLWGVNLEYVYHAQGWRCRAAAEGLLPADFVDEHGSVWLTSMLMSIFQMLGGWGKIGPKNDVESLEVIFAITIGTALFAYVQGSVLQYITQGSPAAMEYRAGLDALNYMFKEVRGVTQEMRRKARTFYRKASHGLHKRERYGEVRCRHHQRRKAPIPQGPNAARPRCRKAPMPQGPDAARPRCRKAPMPQGPDAARPRCRKASRAASSRTPAAQPLHSPRPR
jgi:hypothetical protein